MEMERLYNGQQVKGMIRDCIWTSSRKSTGIQLQVEATKICS